MPKQGNAFGIDCSSGNTLRNLPWPSIKAWRAAIPANAANGAIPNGLPETPCVFAGRYFNPWASNNNWQVDENKGVRTAEPPNAQPLNADLEYVVPIQGFKDNTQNLRVSGKNPDGSVQEKAEIVQKWGADDAKGLCGRIVQAVGRNELKYPLFNTVVVYLDIEPNVTLSGDYWYGWASTVYWYCTGFHHPFYPGLYCTTKHNPDDHGNNMLHRIPSDDVQGALTDGPNTLASICCGIWAANPQTDTTGFNDPAFPMTSRYDSNFRPDWENRFDEWKQKIHVIFGLIPWNSTIRVRLWQYGSEPVPPNPNKAGFNALNVDLDEKSPDCEALAWMLKVI